MWWQATTGVLWALLAFAAVSTGARAWLVRPWPDDSEVTAKLDWLARNASTVDALYLGSSRVFRSFVPAVVDAAMAARGEPISSFNLGGPGMEAFETDHLLREVLALDGLELDYVFIEPAPANPALDARNLDSERTLNWHSTHQTLRALRSIASAPGPRREKWRHALRHVTLWARRTANLGCGARWLTAGPGPGRAGGPLGQLALSRDRGYQALEDVVDPLVSARRRRFRAEPEAYRQRIAGLPAAHAVPVALADVDLRALRDQVDAVRAAGAEPIYVLPPGAIGTPYARALDRTGRLPPLLIFDDPTSEPRLYRPDRRFDTHHLSRQGAVEFSQRFAEVLAARLAADP